MEAVFQLLGHYFSMLFMTCDKVYMYTCVNQSKGQVKHQLSQLYGQQ